MGAEPLGVVRNMSARQLRALRPTSALFVGRVRAQELCESRGGRPELPVPNSPRGLCGH